MKQLKVRVTSSNINYAKKGDSRRCMIANALQEVIPNAKFIIVDAQSIRYTDPKTHMRHVYLTPANAQRALIAFDKGATVKPFAFSASTGYIRLSRVKQGAVNRTVKRVKNTSTRKKRYMPRRYRKFGLRVRGNA